VISPFPPTPSNPGAGDPGAGSPGAGAPGNPGPAPSRSRSKSPGIPGSSRPAGTTTLTGTVEAGVEPNCLLLDGHLLLGGPREVLRPGARVSVTGRVQADLMTTCQQGTPFLVDTAKTA